MGVAAQERLADNVVPLSRARSSTTAHERRLTKREVARRWQVSERTVERWMRAGLPFEKRYEHGAVRFVASLVEAWVNEKGGGK